MGNNLYSRLMSVLNQEMAHLTTFRFSTIVLSGKLIYPWSDRTMKMSREKRKKLREYFISVKRHRDKVFLKFSRI